MNPDEKVFSANTEMQKLQQKKSFERSSIKNHVLDIWRSRILTRQADFSEASL